MILRILSILFLAALLVNCSSQQQRRQRPAPSAVFTPHISEDGTKIFEVELVFTTPSGSRDGASGGRGGRGGAGAGGSGGGRSGGAGGGRSGGGAGRSGGGGGAMPSGGGRSGGGRSGGPAGADRAAMMDAQIAEVVEENGYCREGYVELDRSQEQAVFTFRGECKEAASDEDRARFESIEENAVEPTN